MTESSHTTGEIIWSRSKDNDDSSSMEDEIDIDDEYLIRAYEKSRKLALSKLKISETPDTKRKQVKSVLKNSSQPVKKSEETVEKMNSNSPFFNSWKVGDHCLAVYEEDGLAYEAEIIHISTSRLKCIIKYCDYDDEEEKYLKEVSPLPPDYQVSQNSLIECQTPKSEKCKSRTCESCGCPPGSASTQGFILPPPLLSTALPTLQSPSESSSSTFHCALMSWYMAGFHTGYHQAVTNLRSGNHDDSTSKSYCPSATGFSQNGISQMSNNFHIRSSTKKPSPV